MSPVVQRLHAHAEPLRESMNGSFRQLATQEHRIIAKGVGPLEKHRRPYVCTEMVAKLRRGRDMSLSMRRQYVHYFRRERQVVLPRSRKNSLAGNA